MSRQRDLAMRDLWKDLTFGSRMLLRTPAVAAALIATVAVAIAANSVAFSFLNAFLIRPLPVEEPQQLARIYSSFAGGARYFTVSHPDYTDVRNSTGVFSDVIADEPAAVSLGAAGEKERLWGSRVTANYFSTLGVKPAAGRFFGIAEVSTPEGRLVVVLSHGLWQRRFHGSRDVIGAPALVNGASCTIIGVAPPEFHGVHTGISPELWLPIENEGLDRGARQYFVTGRLLPGVDLEQARAALDVLARRLQQDYPATNDGVTFAVLSESDGRVHPLARSGILGFSGVLLAIAVLVLVLACVNVAGILRVRAVARRKEIAARLALGATRGRIIRQLLTESVLLSLLGGALGVVVAWAVIEAVTGIHFPTRVPLHFDLGLDLRVLGFSLGTMGIAALLFGLLPALQAARSDIFTSLKEGGAATGLRGSRSSGIMISAQVALSTALLIGAGLFLRSLQKARQLDVGFDPRDVVLTSVDVGLHGYDREAARRFFRSLVDRLSSLPGTQSVSLASAVPFEVNITTLRLAPEGFEASRSSGLPAVDFSLVGAGYFRTLRIPLLEGREFRSSDTRSTPPVVIVNEVLARQFWPAGSALGKRVKLSGGATLEVVGVARRGRYLTLGEPPKPFVFLPVSQNDARALTVLLRTAAGPVAALRELENAVRSLDDTVPLYNVTTMSEHVGFALFPAQGEALVLDVLGFIALLLTAIGLYGMLAHTVSRRTFEIGVRRALGARDGDVLALVLRQTVVPVAVGLAVGVACGLAASRLIEGLLYGVDAADPAVLSMAPLVLLCVAVVAAGAPAYRSLRIEAVRALRYE